MNGARERIQKIWTLPGVLRVEFKGRDGAPDEQHVNPILRYENCDKCLARLDVIEWTPKYIVIELPAELECHGLGRYEVCMHEGPCRVCDCVKIEFCGECAATNHTYKETEEHCDARR